MLLVFYEKKIKNDNSNNIIDCVETRHEETMQKIKG